MSRSSVVNRNGGNPDQLTLDDLKVAIEREHASVLGTPSERIEAAIHCGEHLLLAQQQTDSQTYWIWLGELNMHRTTAYRYMRLARHADEVRSGEYDGIDPAIEGIRTGKRPRRTDEDRDEIVRMRQAGMTMGQIAEALDMSVSTVYYWSSAKNAKRRGSQRRATRARERHAELRQQAQVLAKGIGGAMENGYSFLRRCEQQIDKSIAGLDSAKDREIRVALRRALGHLHAAEDELTRAMALRVKRDDRS